MFTNEEIEAFLHGNDDEQFIVAIEFDYVSNSIFKIKEVPGKGKEIRKDTFIPFAWVGIVAKILVGLPTGTIARCLDIVTGKQIGRAHV